MIARNGCRLAKMATLALVASAAFATVAIMVVASPADAMDSSDSQCVDAARASIFRQARFAAVSEAAAQAIFKKMDESTSWHEAAPARAAIRIAKKTRLTTELALDRFFDRGQERVERSVELSFDASERLSAVVKSKLYLRQSDGGPELLTQSASQTFLIYGPGCTLSLTDWSVVAISPTEYPGRLEAKETQGSSDPSVQTRVVSRVSSVESIRNSRLAEILSREPSKIKKSLRLFTFVSASSPEALLEVDPVAEPARAFDPIAGGARDLNQAKIAARFGGETLFSGRMLWSESDGFSELDDLSTETWALPETYLAGAKLEASQEASSKIENSVADDRLGEAGISLILTVNKPLDYVNLAQYWKQTRIKAVGPKLTPIALQASSGPGGDSLSDSNRRYTYVLTPVASSGFAQAAKSKAVAPEDRFGRPELRATSWIQSDLPVIHEAAEKILLSSSGDRLDLATKVLEEVNLRLEFDSTRLPGSIRPMTTEDALQKRKVVCQHFANLFVALSRAVGVPARIVVGARLSAAGSEPHAWAEFEASEDGAWIPVEPQATSLAFPIGRYLPLAISASLDDPSDEAAVAAEMAAFFYLRAEIKDAAPQKEPPPQPALESDAVHF